MCLRAGTVLAVSTVNLPQTWAEAVPRGKKLQIFNFGLLARKYIL
jgi:hypothetical protein